MTRIILLATLLLVSFSGALAQQADAITGTWFNEEKDAKIEVYKSGNQYLGKIIWAKRMYDADGKTLRKDIENPVAKLAKRTIINLVILTGLTYNDGTWTGGQIYDPKSGKQYTCNAKLEGQNLNIRGYIGIPMFGRTTVWTRTQ